MDINQDIINIYVYSKGTQMVCYDYIRKGNVNECHTTLVKNLIKESFYGKRKKKAINVLIAFFISHKSDVKTFLKWILNQCYTALINMT